MLVGGLNQDCIKAMSAEDEWRCLFAPVSGRVKTKRLL